MNKFKKRKGITAIEIVITIGIIGIMMSSMGMAINRKELALNLGHRKLGALINRAKSLTMFGVFQGQDRFCGYGVEIDASGKKASIFKTSVIVSDTNSGECPKDSPSDMDGVFARNGLTGELNELKLDKFLSFGESAYIFFIPPDPSVYIYDSQGVQTPSATIEMKNEAGNSIRKIEVNSAGLIDLL